MTDKQDLLAKCRQAIGAAQSSAGSLALLKESLPKLNAQELESLRSSLTNLPDAFGYEWDSASRTGRGLCNGLCFPLTLVLTLGAIYLMVLISGLVFGQLPNSVSGGLITGACIVGLGMTVPFRNFIHARLFGAKITGRKRELLLGLAGEWSQK